MSFAELGLNEALLATLTQAGYQTPTPVQSQSIPHALNGLDLLVSAQTGSGKTAAFMLPALQRCLDVQRPADLSPAAAPGTRQRRATRHRPEHFPRVVACPRLLVLVPTRELAQQVCAAADKYSAGLRRVRSAAILGGMPYPKQLQSLARDPEILVATPGRLIDHLRAGRLDFARLEMLVLDEADRMLDMGFIDDIDAIVAATPATRQTMLFSATLGGTVGHVAQRITRDPVRIEVAAAQTRHDHIAQRLHFVDDLAHKNRLLDHLLRDASIDQAVVFTATKRDADEVAIRLDRAGFNAAALHGDMHQRARNRTLEALRRRQLKILVATDVAARGIDVPGITHVFNFDLPKFAEDYVHRIGRTGRAGRSGQAVSLVAHADQRHVRQIERFTRQPIPVEIIAGHEPQRSAAAKPGRPGGKPRQMPGQGRRHDGRANPGQPGAARRKQASPSSAARKPAHGRPAR